MKEYDIGELVLHVHPYDKQKTVGIIVDKREDEGEIKYSIEWCDDYRDDGYHTYEIEIYTSNVAKHA